MKSILVRDIPEKTLESLKSLAAYHHRSLQGELHSILEEASRRAPAPEPFALALKTVDTGGRGTWRRDEIYGDEAR